MNSNSKSTVYLYNKLSNNIYHLLICMLLFHDTGTLSPCENKSIINDNIITMLVYLHNYLSQK